MVGKHTEPYPAVYKKKKITLNTAEEAWNKADKTKPSLGSLQVSDKTSLTQSDCQTQHTLGF